MYEEEIRTLSAKLLEKGEGVIGYAPGTLPFRTRPFLCQKKEDTEHLIFNHFCGVNLARYLLSKDLKGKKVAVLAKGCDARSIMVLLKEGQINRENLIIVGLPCYGMVSSQ